MTKKPFVPAKPRAFQYGVAVELVLNRAAELPDMTSVTLSK